MLANIHLKRHPNFYKPLYDIIPRASLYTLSNQPPVDFKKGADKLRSAKANTAFITNLVLSLQARPETDIDYVFKHKNLREPRALLHQGKMRSGTK
jgi:hypothetical protein